jgi:hypothetical protein
VLLAVYICVFTANMCLRLVLFNQHVGQRHACEPMRSVRGGPPLAAVGVYVATYRSSMSSFLNRALETNNIPSIRILHSHLL